MAQVQQLKILVVDGGGSGSGSGIDNDEFIAFREEFESFLDGTGEDPKNPRRVGNKTVGKATKILAFANTVIGYASPFLNYYVSDIGRKTGDSNHQAQVNRNMEVLSDGTGLLMSGLQGGLAGAYFGGPVGFVVGAGIAMLQNAMSLGFKYAERDRAYQHEQFTLKTTQQYLLSRANYSYATGRVR